MNRQDVEKNITEYLKPLFGFALRRCKNIHDAEDLSQEIAIRAFRALLVKDDVTDIGKFIWTVAHNTLSNYYRDTAKSMFGVSIDDVTEILEDSDLFFDDIEKTDTVHRLQSEIAYLSKLQRRIVISYYFENRKQADIARELNIPLGTVKWHLFEAKKELKRGMDTMRRTSELKFNPIKFHSLGFNGSIGTKSLDEFFRSTLSQNICYCVRNQAKTINEIADDLGISPVYIETEVDFLEKYCFLNEQKGKYIVNFIISEPTAELLTMQNEMYKKVAGLFANELYDELINSDILDEESIFCNHVLPGSTPESQLRDKNFLLWALIPYIAACSGEKLMDNKISFEEVATIRPDGGYNICHASVVDENMVLPDDYVYMKNWRGPMWNGNGTNILWQIDSEWSCRDENHMLQYAENAKRILSLYEQEHERMLSKEDYAWLSERGYIKTWGDYEGYFKTSWQIIVLANKDIRDKLLAVGEKIKTKYKTEFDAIKAPYAVAVLDSVPPHLRKIMKYELQFTFYSDGWFLLHCIVALLNNGKLKLPSESQKSILTTLVLPE